MRRSCIAILTIFLLSFPNYANAQLAPNIDSLKNELKNTRGLERAVLLIELGSQTRQTDVHKAIRQITEALDIARRLGDEKLQSNALTRLGYFHSIIKKDAEALEYYLIALDLERENGDQLAEAKVLHQLGRFYMGQEYYSKALEYYFKALRIREAEGDKSGSSVTLSYIGTVYNLRDEQKEALTFYKPAYSLSKEAENYRQMSMAASSIAIIYQELDSLEVALSYYQRGLDAAEALNSSHAKATILLHMSSAYQDQKLFDEALSLNKEQITIARTNKSKFLEAQGLQNLAGLYRDQGNLERSNQYLDEAKLLFEEIGYPEDRVAITNELAQNFLKQGQISESIEKGRDALTGAKAIGSLDESQSALETLVQAYTQQGDYPNAYQTQAELTAVRDSIFNKEQEKQIARMQTRYETDKKEQEIALLQKEQENAKLTRNAFGAGLILILIIGLLIYNRQRLKIKKNRTDLESKRLKEQQLKQDLEFKNKQLTTHSLNLVQKNEVMRELKENISEIKKKAKGGEVSRKLGSVQNLVDYSFNLDEDWEEFKLYFEEVHTGFFDTLKQYYPDLTPNELRLSALVKLNLTTKEIATIMGITPDSVKTARYRLRKKLDMETEENLTDFMMSVERDIKV